MRKVLYVLGQLDDQDADWMARAGSRRSLQDGETIIRQGEHTAYLYILLAGHLAVDIAGAGRVARLQTGEVVGEMSFVDSAPSSATVLADGQAMVLALPKPDLEVKIAQDPGFGLRFYRALALFLADRLRTAQQTKAGALALGSDATQEDELDDMLLDTVSLGGDRFDRMMRRLAGMR